MNRIALTCLLVMSMFVFRDIAAAQTATPSTSASAQPDAQAEPILVLIQYDPWAMVIGSDGPQFALYDDGTAIYQKGPKYYVARLGPSEMSAFLGSLRMDLLGEQDRHYALTNFTDQADTIIQVGAGSGRVRLSVYGSLESPNARAMLPRELLDAYAMLNDFEWTEESVWLPDLIEVMIWPYEHSVDESVTWPERWPGTLHPSARNRGDGYSLYLPASEYEALQDFRGTVHERGAVLIDGKKWAVSVRFPFPKEQRWMGAAAGDPSTH